jgi:hypothetical protein
MRASKQGEPGKYPFCPPTYQPNNPENWFCRYHHVRKTGFSTSKSLQIGLISPAKQFSQTKWPIWQGETAGESLSFGNESATHTIQPKPYDNVEFKQNQRRKSLGRMSLSKA